MPIIKKCLVCRKKFKARLYLVKKGRGKYCSKNCANFAKKRKTLINSGSFKKGQISWNKKNLNSKKIIYLYFKEKKTLTEIGKMFRCSYNVITRILKENGLKPRTNSESLKGRLAWNKGLKGTMKPNSGSFKKGQFTKEKHPGWKGGKYRNGGYWLILKPEHPNSNKQGYIRKARFVVSEYLNRYLEKEEVVHHINGIKDDDRPENLYLFSFREEHDRYETLLRYGKVQEITESNLRFLMKTSQIRGRLRR